LLKLTCTANDMALLAEAAGFDPPVQKWQPAERAELTAELDAAFFHLYGLTRTETEYVLSTFSGMKSDQQTILGSSSQPGLLLAAYDRLGEPSQSRGS
jgi:hypothetical protein